MGEDLIAASISKIVDAGGLAGAATLVWRNGKVIQTAAVGWRDIESKLPIERKTLFRIAFMTKPITSTAALMLFEEGRFALSDPITRWAPEFSQMRVPHSPTGPLDQTDPADNHCSDCGIPQSPSLDLKRQSPLITFQTTYPGV